MLKSRIITLNTNLLRNSDTYMSPYVLMYGDILNFKTLKSVKYNNYVTNATLSFEFGIDKYTIWKIKKLIKYEPNFFNLVVKKGAYVVVFNIPKKYITLCNLMYTKNGTDIVNNNILQKVLGLIDKKAPTA